MKQKRREVALVLSVVISGALLVLMFVAVTWEVCPEFAPAVTWLKELTGVCHNYEFVQHGIDVMGFVLATVALPLTIWSLKYARDSIENADRQVRMVLSENERRSREVVLFEDFPDPAFRAFLRGLYSDQHSARSRDGDDPPPTGFSQEDLEKVTSINVDGIAVSSLDGIGAFAYLEDLSCNETPVEAINVNGLKKLKHISAKGCRRLETVHCAGCESLRILDLDASSVKELDCSKTKVRFGGIGCEDTLVSLVCRSVSPVRRRGSFDGLHLSAIDLDLFPRLVHLDCSDNEISKIMARRPSQLRTLYARDNGLTEIDPAACRCLESLTCTLAPGVNKGSFLLNLIANGLSMSCQVSLS